MSECPKLALAEWKLDQIKQYFDAWDAGELPAHKALESINFTLGKGLSTL